LQPEAAAIAREARVAQEAQEAQQSGAQLGLGKAAPDIRLQITASEQRTIQAQEELALGIKSQRAAKAKLASLEAQQRQVLPDEVRRTGQKIPVAALSTKKAGQFYKAEYEATRKAVKDVANAKYDEVQKLDQGLAHPRSALEDAIDVIDDQAGTLKRLQSTKASQAGRELRNVGDDLVEEGDQAATRFKGLMEGPRTRREGGLTPGEIYAQALRETSVSRGVQGLNPATIKEMMPDRQIIREIARVADKTGRRFEGQQLRILEKGMTKDLEAIQGVAKRLQDADKFYATDYIPNYGFQAATFKATLKSDEAVVQFFFKKAKPGQEGNAIALVETLNNTIKNPEKLGRTLLEGMLERSKNPDTRLFEPTTFFRKEWDQYPDRVLDVAFGGAQARKEIGAIVDRMRQQKALIFEITEQGKLVEVAERKGGTLEQLAKKVTARSEPGLATPGFKDIKIAKRQLHRQV